MIGLEHDRASGAHLDAVANAGRRILQIQTADGGIAWFENGPWDPWNHVEAAMALTALGAHDHAEAAFAYLRATQRTDGAWTGEYGNALPMRDRDYIARQTAPAFLDSNFCAYPAVGVAHRYLKTGDRDWLRRQWQMVEASIEFVLGLQLRNGTFSWSLEAHGTSVDRALLAGNASIYKSLECAIFLADELGRSVSHWKAAQGRLKRALRYAPEAFEQSGSEAGFAMDWYYPVLSGALRLPDAQRRILAGWPIYVNEALGCKCVDTEPWITVAETCELVMALLRMADRPRAVQLMQAIMAVRDDAGVFWMGWQTEEALIWPKEQPSWTQAAAILALDALSGSDPSSQLLVSPFGDLQLAQ